MRNLLFWIPLLPLAGFLVNGLGGKRLPRWLVSLVGCSAPAASAALSLVAFLEVAREGQPLVWTLGDWIRSGGLHVPFTLVLDRLSGVMALVVTGVGSLIHVYSIGYMQGDRSYARFFSYLNLFTAAMLILVLADNVVLLFLGWEGVGLSSYLLIGFWYEDLANCSAGIKAFVVNRVGDLGFLLGIFLIYITFGTFQFSQLNALAPGKEGSALAAIGLLLFVGATGKSAQIPLHVWLPDAMAGPTPVSALIHAATMVTSGVYLLARLGPLYLASGVLPVVAAVGAVTALFAALVALTQTDIKKVLAYSTISQLGYMFLAAGLGLFGVAVFHLVTHSFFKALLFLGAGAVMHSVHGLQDMREMGGLRRKIPRTAAVFTAGAAALAGFPLTSGFFSKDEILHGAWSAAADGEALRAGWLALWGVGIVTAALTALYAFRQVSLVFLEPRSRAKGAGPSHEGVHESPPSMMVPLYVLAALSLLGGLLPVPGFLSNEFLALDLPSHGAAAAHADGKLLGWLLGGTVSLAGIACAFALFVWAPGIRERALETSRVLAWFAGLSSRKFYVDELYDLVVVRPFRALSLVLFYVVDRLLIDWILVAGAALLVRGAGSALRRLQAGRIPVYTALFLLGVLGLVALAFWSIR